MTILRHALAYAAAGWPIFPCDPETKRPLTADGFKAATTEAGQVEAWWTRWPTAMIGVPTGPRLADQVGELLTPEQLGHLARAGGCGAFVVDLDPPAAADVEPLLAELARLVGADLGAVPGVATPRGGLHLYFAWPDGEWIGNRARLHGLPIDVRGAGGYVIAPPSRRAGGKAIADGVDGVAYSWRHGVDLAAPGAPALPPAPPALLDLVLRRGAFDPRQAPADPAPLDPAPRGTATPAGIDDRRRRYALAALDGEVRDLAATPQGGRNDAINRAAFRLGQLVGAGLLVEAVVRAALRQVVDAWPDRPKSHGTIESGLAGGRAQPADLAAIGTRGGAPRPSAAVRPAAPSTGERPAASGEGGGDHDQVDEIEIVAECAGQPLNDTGNGRRLINWHGDNLLNVREVGEHFWAGSHWARDGAVEYWLRCAQTTAPRIAWEARELQPSPEERAAIERHESGDDAAAGGDIEEARRRIKAEADAARKAVAARRQARRRFAISSGNAARLAAMQAQAVPHLTVPPADLDAEPLAINVANGTLRLVSEKVLDPDCPDPAVDRYIDAWRARLDPHERRDLISHCAAVPYQAGAEAPAWQAFLDLVQPDVEVQAFLARWAGYALTGLTGEQLFVFFYGAGANGKSTFMEVLARIAGDYACTLPAEALTGDMQRRGDQATPELARLPGARLVRAAELQRGQAFREALLKQLTGGEPLLVRHLHRGFFEMAPVFKLVGSGNDRPRIDGVDEGIWRRVRLVTWSQTIPAGQRRPFETVVRELVETEGAGILNWCLAGLIDYLERGGLAPPASVLDDTASYRDDSDPIGEFVTAHVLNDRDGEVQARHMYEAYLGWSHVNGVRPWGEKQFGMVMAQKGFEKRRGAVRVYVGVRLNNPPPPPA